MVLMHAAHGTALQAQTIGEAFDLNSNELLYSETHCLTPDAVTRQVLYRNPEGELIAYKVLDYEAGSTTPSFEQHNLYSNESVAVALQRGAVVVTTSDDRSSGESSSSTLTPASGSPVVIDAGFDAFVTRHWGNLVAGEQQRFQFPVAASEALVKLQIEAAPCSYQTQSDQCFRLAVDNWLLRLVADSIELGYDAQSRRLTRFRGVSNIGDGSGSGLAVDIHYRYHDLAALQCDI
tara:strand:- start:13002 stop:13706 length:705 start_codon:yes stop_codon:yes gene_type:complete